VRISEDEFSTHMKTITDAGFTPNPKEFMSLAGWNYILLQLRMAGYYIRRLRTSKQELGDLDNAYEQNAFFCAFLTTYAKCFVSAEGRAVTLDATEVFKSHRSARSAHNRIIKLRHRYAAHNADSGLVRTTMAAKEEDDRFVIQHLITLATPINEFESFASVVELVSDYVTVRLNQLLAKLEKKLGKLILLD